MSTRGHLIATCAGGPALGFLAVGAYALGRYWGGLVQALLDTPISERERRASNPSFSDAQGGNQ